MSKVDRPCRDLEKVPPQALENCIEHSDVPTLRQHNLNVVVQFPQLKLLIDVDMIAFQLGAELMLLWRLPCIAPLDRRRDTGGEAARRSGPIRKICHCLERLGIKPKTLSEFCPWVSVLSLFFTSSRERSCAFVFIANKSL